MDDVKEAPSPPRDVNDFLDEELQKLREKYEYSVLTSYEKYPSFTYSSIVVNQYIEKIRDMVSASTHSYLLLSHISPLRNVGQICNLCLKFYYDKKQSMLQLAYAVWRQKQELFPKHEKHHITETSVFRGVALVQLMQSHLPEYRLSRERIIQEVCPSLLKYKYIQSAQSSNHAFSSSAVPSSERNDYASASGKGYPARHNGSQNEPGVSRQYRLVQVSPPRPSSRDTKRKSSKQFSEHAVYQFSTSRLHEFVALSQPDRDAWTVGCKLQVFSESLHGWQNGVVLHIDKNYVTVAYGPAGQANQEEKEQEVADIGDPNTFPLAMRKVIHRYDEESIQSSDAFITHRQQLHVSDTVSVYSNTYRLWCRGEVIEMLPIDHGNIFKVRYAVLDRGSKYIIKFKYVHRWSSRIRLDSEIDPGFHQPALNTAYQKGVEVRVWSHTDQQWVDGIIKDTVTVYGLFTVRYGRCEKLLHINSPYFRLKRQCFAE
mmetsp:Transcript_37719/g.62011  ORF Transcript_37719/g.62011 Transcript_37719/m.62011 type:complete len:486 (-) Transcript_37719:34-1491(-)